LSFIAKKNVHDEDDSSSHESGEKQA